jgi:DNA-binding transcriptional MerR regulator
MKKSNILSTGAFAKLCKTTKETLFHYERESLLKPKYVSENGYRYYGVEQYFDFELITTLKETGSSLKEIKAHFQRMDGEALLSLLETKQQVIKKERAKLAQRDTMLQDMAALTREALNFDYDTFMVQRQEEERLEVFSTTADSEESTAELVGRIIGYSNFYGKQVRFPRYPFGMIIEQENVLRGQYLEKYFFGRATRSTSRSQLHCKPEGTYAVLAHTGPRETHVQIFQKLLRKIQDAGLTVSGNLYGYDMMSYILQGAGERYAIKYCVQVQE